MSANELSTFYVYRKGQEKPAVVRAETVVENAILGNLMFKVGDEIVASFPKSEVQGWEKRPKGK